MNQVFLYYLVSLLVPLNLKLFSRICGISIFEKKTNLIINSSLISINVIVANTKNEA